MSMGSLTVGYNRKASLDADAALQDFSTRLSTKNTMKKAFTGAATSPSQGIQAKSNKTIAQEIAPNKSFATKAPVKQAETRISKNGAVDKEQAKDNQQAIGAGQEQNKRVQTDYQKTMAQASNGLQKQVGQVAGKEGVSMSQVYGALGPGPSSDIGAFVKVASDPLVGSALTMASAVQDIIKAGKAIKPGHLQDMVETAVKTAQNTAQGPAAFPGAENKSAPVAPQQIAYQNLSGKNATSLLQGQSATNQQREMKDLEQQHSELNEMMAENQNALENGNQTANAETIAAAMERQDAETLATLDRLDALKENFGPLESSLEVDTMSQFVNGAISTTAFGIDSDTANTLAKQGGFGSTQNWEPDMNKLGAGSNIAPSFNSGLAV